MSGEENGEREKKGFFGGLFGGGGKDNAPRDEVGRQEPEPQPDDAGRGEDLPGEPGETPVTESVSEQNSEIVSKDSSEDITDKTAVATPDETPEDTVADPLPEAGKTSWFQRLKSGLTKSSSKLTEGITGIFTKSKLDDEALENLEDLLIQSDLGVGMAMRITERLAESRYDKDISPDEVRAVLRDEVAAILKPVARPLEISPAHKPHILLMVGVNGAGKTTTIGKLAQKFRAEGKSVMLAAGDTFRAAAIDQLKVWGGRTGAPVIAKPEGADASGLVYEALEAAKAGAVDVLMIDTAGRLQNKTELMAELEKIVRVIKKFDESGPHDVVLTLDATTGQNALNQVEIFGATSGVTGLVMTKLDGSARGGILVAIADKFELPVYAIGVGEGVEDMQPFDPEDFANAIAGL